MFLFAASNIIGLIFTALASMWCANLVGPQQMGVFNTLQLIVNYSPILTFGILNGLNREIPHAIGQSDTTKVYKLAGAAHFISLLASWVSAFIMLIIAFIAYNKGYKDWSLGFLVFAAIVPISLMRFFVEITYRTGNDFKWLSITKIITSILAVALVPILYKVAWEGLLLRAILFAWIGYNLLWLKRKIISTPIWNTEAIKLLLKSGFPIFIVGFIYSALLSVDRLIITYELGTKALGIYTPSILILQGMAVLPASIMQVIYPKAVEEFSRTSSARSILSFIFKPLPLLILLQLPFVFISWLYIPYVINLYMPEFTDGIKAAQWSVIAGFFLTLSTPTLIFNILKKQIHYIAIILLSIVILYVFAHIFISRGYGLASIPIALTLSFVFFVALSAIFAVILCNNGTYSQS